MGAEQSNMSAQSNAAVNTPTNIPVIVDPKSNSIQASSNMYSDKLHVKALTTYLGTLFEKEGIDITKLEYNGKSLENASNYKSIIGKYEAGLTQAAYFSRLSYELNPVITAMSQLTNYNPIVFNTALSLIRRKYSRYRTNNLQINNINEGIDKGSIYYIKKGLIETPCYLQLLDYTNINENCPYAGERILYVAFRGTISLKSALTNAKATPASLTKLFTVSNFEGINGMDAFKNELERTNGAMFSSHYGFIENLEPLIHNILNQIEIYLKDNKPINKIIITGHSLGGANATLFSMILAGFKKAGVSLLQNTSIHCITFGAPKLFSDYARNVFNNMLDNKILTLDRIANRIGSILIGSVSAGVSMNLVPTIPPNFVHPGYMILKTEIKTQSRTGRSKNISDIREMFGGIASSGYFSFNGLPTYPEFLSNFKQIASDNYSKLLTKQPLATLYSITSNSEYNNIKQLVQTVIGQVEDISPAQQQQEIIEANIEQNSEIKVDETEQNGGGPQTELYKKTTIERGSNHIVYNCQKNISHASCHMAYMGISFWGGLKNISLGRQPYSTININSNTISLLENNTIPQLGGKQYRHAKKTMKRKLSKASH